MPGYASLLMPHASKYTEHQIQYNQIATAHPHDGLAVCVLSFKQIEPNASLLSCRIRKRRSTHCPLRFAMPMQSASLRYARNEGKVGT